MDVRPYPRKLNVGDVQEMVFVEVCDGPFYMKCDDQQKKKYDSCTGEMKVVEKTKKKLIENLKEKKFVVRGSLQQRRVAQVSRRLQDSTYLSSRCN